MTGLLACIAALGWLLEHLLNRSYGKYEAFLQESIRDLETQRDKACRERDEMFQAAWELKGYYERLQGQLEEKRRCTLH